MQLLGNLPGSGWSIPEAHPALDICNKLWKVGRGALRTRFPGRGFDIPKKSQR